MMLPDILGENLFDDWMNTFDIFSRGQNPLFGKRAKNIMKTDVRETEKYIRKERYAGAMSRSFFVGNGVTEDEVKAKYEDGILRLSIPKKSENPSVESKKLIAIEG